MAGANFTRKQVGSMTLGERLRKLRSDHRLSVFEVSRATKIQAKYIEAIENGDYEKLPADVYVRGFLRNYAAYLSVPEEAILKLYERERKIQKNLGNISSLKFQPKIPIPFSFDISTKTAITGGAIFVAFSFFAYLYTEFRSFVSEPGLVVLEPFDGAVVEKSEVLIRGETDARANVIINGETTIVDEAGNFGEIIQLQPGINTLSVVATNRFGKERREEVTIRADVEQSDSANNFVVVPSDSTRVLLLRSDFPVALSVSADGVLVFSGTLNSGEEKRFEAKNLFEVSSENGAVTRVRFENNEEAPLSSDAAPATVFFGEKIN